MATNLDDTHKFLYNEEIIHFLRERERERETERQTDRDRERETERMNTMH